MHVHALLGDSDVFAELVRALPLAVEDALDPRRLHAKGAYVRREVVRELVAEHRLVVVVREQHPVLRLGDAEHLGLLVELELPRLLRVVLRRVAAHVNFHRAIVERFPFAVPLHEDAPGVLLLVRAWRRTVVRRHVQDREFREEELLAQDLRARSVLDRDAQPMFAIL